VTAAWAATNHQINKYLEIKEWALKRPERVDEKLAEKNDA